MDGFKVGAVALLALVIIVLVRQWKPEWGMLLRMAAAVVLMSLVVSAIAGVMDEMRDISGQALPQGALPLIYKALGVALLTQLCTSVCRDCGESGLAVWVEIAGKTEILLLSLPLMRDVLRQATELLDM